MSAALFLTRLDLLSTWRNKSVMYAPPVRSATQSLSDEMVVVLRASVKHGPRRHADLRDVARIETEKHDIRAQEAREGGIRHRQAQVAKPVKSLCWRNCVPDPLCWGSARPAASASLRAMRSVPRVFVRVMPWESSTNAAAHLPVSCAMLRSGSGSASARLGWASWTPFPVTDSEAALRLRRSVQYRCSR